MKDLFKVTVKIDNEWVLAFVANAQLTANNY